MAPSIIHADKLTILLQQLTACYHYAALKEAILTTQIMANKLKLCNMQHCNLADSV
jgi:hypothetical protein